MRVFGTLFLASTVLLNSIEFSIQAGQSGSSSNPPPPATAKPPPKNPRTTPHKLPKPTKGVPTSTPKPPQHPGTPHPAAQPSSTPHPGPSSANPPPAPGAPPAPKKRSRTQPKPTPDFGVWPQILKPGTRLGDGSSSPAIPTGLIRLDENRNIIGRPLSELGFVILIPKDYSNIVLHFRKYTFFPEQKLVLYYEVVNGPSIPIPASEQIVIVNAGDWALAVLMPNGLVIGTYIGKAKTGRRKVHTINNEVRKLEGDETKYVAVGSRQVLPSLRYGIQESKTNSLLESYGRKGGGGVTPQPPHGPTHDTPSPDRPAKRPRQNP